MDRRTARLVIMLLLLAFGGVVLGGAAAGLVEAWGPKALLLLLPF